MAFGFNKIYGQSISVQSRLLTSEEGMASNNVLGLLQSKDGQMWISTDQGLDRYDGENFEHFTAKRHGLPSNQNDLLLEDTEGLLWVGKTSVTFERGYISYKDLRINIFDPLEKKGLSFSEYFGQDVPLQESDIHGICQDKEQGLWISTARGQVFRYSNGHFELQLDNHGAFPIYRALPAKEGGFWVLSGHFLHRMQPDGQMLESDTLPFAGSYISLLSGGALAIRNRLVSKSSFPNVLLKHAGAPVEGSYQFPGGEKLDIRTFRGIHDSPDQKLWCRKNDGFEVYDKSGALAFDLAAQLPDYAKLSLTSFPYFDHNGLAWLPVADGILLLKLENRYFNAFLRGEKISVRGIIGLPDGQLLVNSYNGPLVLNPGNGNYQALPEFFTGLGLAHGPDGTVWLGEHGAKVFRYYPQDGKIERIELLDFDALTESIQPFVSRNGTTWIGTSNGLARLDTAVGSFRMCEALNWKYGLANRSVRSFLEVEEGVYLATDGGLFLFHPDKGIIEPALGLPPIDLYHMQQVAPGQFWLASRGEGLWQWNDKTGRYRQYSVEDGLPSNVIYAVYPCRRGYLWLSTQDGLCAFHPDRREMHVFQTKSGLPFNEFNYLAHYQATDGTLYFGGVRGIVAFRPEDIVLEEDSRAQLQVTRFQQYNRKEGGMEDLTATFLKTPRIYLRPSDDFFILDFVLQDYLAPEENRYAYRLGGLDEEWQYIRESQIRLSGLPYGRYQLRIKAMGHDGRWAEKELNIPVEVARPLQAYWWFWPGLCFLALAFGYGIFRLRIRSLKATKLRLQEEVARRTAEIEANLAVIAKQKTELEASNRAKDKLFSIIGHELRGPLMFFGNIGDRVSYLLKNNKKDALLALGYSAEEVTASLNAMLENLMYWGLIQSGQFSSQKGILELGKQMKEAVQALQPIAEKKGVQLLCEAPSPEVIVEMGRAGLEIVLRNLIANGIKYTPAGGVVRLSAHRRNGQANLLVEDTGIGMSPEQAAAILQRKLDKSRKGTEGERGAGLGLNITQEILQMNQGSLTIRPGEVTGTVFIVTIPAPAA